MRILDLFCGAGGAAMGLHLAFPMAEIVGVDIVPQPRYPFTFVQADALTYPITADFVWASPPCQHYTAGRRAQRRRGNNPHPDLIRATRMVLRAWGGAYVIENVEGSPLENAIRLCGQMFGLRVIRHRLFESSFPVPTPAHTRHVGSMLDGSIIAVYGNKRYVSGGALKGEVQYHNYGKIPLEFRRLAARQAAMGIDWMTGDELDEAVPPVYAAYVAAHHAAA
jgi:DNA (cytosine-5)-methyltransferase 1